MSVTPYQVTFVCTGNICRSPMAEVIIAAAAQTAGLAGAVLIDSAGLGDWHVGEPADHRAITTLANHGYDGSNHRARVLAPAEITTTHLFIAMDAGHHASLQSMSAFANPHAEIKMLRSFDPDSPPGASVADPFYTDGYAAFEEVLEHITSATPGFIEFLVAETAKHHELQTAKSAER